MQLELITPTGSVFSGEVKLAKFPGSSGSFEILNNHAPIISALTNGELKIETDAGETLSFITSGGIVEVKENRIMVLVETIRKK